MTVAIKRMWVNQPSSTQRFHDLHGRRVLAHVDLTDCRWATVYFADGSVHSQQLPMMALSEGWIE